MYPYCRLKSNLACDDIVTSNFIISHPCNSSLIYEKKISERFGVGVILI